MAIRTTIFLNITKQNQRQSFSIANNMQKKRLLLVFIPIQNTENSCL